MAYTILLVDDHTAIREGFATVLTDAGYTVLTAGDVKSAQQLLATEQPDLLITDVRLRGYNGLHLIAMAPRPIPAIVVTGHADASIEGDARRLGAEYYVKPLTSARLLEIVSRILANSAPKVFTSTRGAPRRPLTFPLSVHVGPHLGRVLDVSATGLRLEVHSADEVELPDSLTLHLGPSRVAIPVNMAWKRQHSDRTWICGAAVAQDASAEWTAFLATL